jgi:hypothetical protein
MSFSVCFSSSALFLDDDDRIKLQRAGVFTSVSVWTNVFGKSYFLVFEGIASISLSLLHPMLVSNLTETLYYFIICTFLSLYIIVVYCFLNREFEHTIFRRLLYSWEFQLLCLSIIAYLAATMWSEYVHGSNWISILFDFSCMACPFFGAATFDGIDRIFPMFYILIIVF